MRKLLLAGAFLFAGLNAAFGADSSVPNMTAGGAISDTDLFYCAQSAGTTDRKCTGLQVKQYAINSAVDARTTTTEAIAATDQNKLVTFNNPAAVACTIAAAGTLPAPAGWAASLKNYGAGTVTCTATTSLFIDASGTGTATLVLLTGQGVDFYSDGTNYIVQGGKFVPGTGVAAASALALSAAGGLTSTVASGTAALGTAAIASATCATAVTVAAANVAATDVVQAGFNGDPTAVVGYQPLTTGMLTIIPYPTAGNVNFKVCNNTGSSITPGAITLNFRVVR